MDFILLIILIWIEKSVDKKIMEIINYSENTSFYGYKPLYNKNKKTRTSASRAEIYKHRDITVREQLLSLKGDALLALKSLKIFVKYSWVLPAAAFICVIPFCVRYGVDYLDSFSKIVDFAEIDQSQLNYLDEAMFDFALDGEAFYDSEGNVLDSDNLPIVSNKSFREPVTYSTYTVKNGDTISGISVKYGLSNISTLIAVNNIGNVRSLSVGQKLKIPSIDGLVYTVKQDDTIIGISLKYNVAVEELLDVNDLSSETLTVGSTLYIPGAKLDAESLQKAMGEMFICPLSVSYRLTSKFGSRADPFTGVASNHTGIDMACAKGTPIKAAMSGSVIYTGYSSLYGNYVILKHYDGYQTLYAHMNQIIAKKGSYVSQGSTIGLVGSTGYSTGPHLHFSVYKNGKLVDPMSVIKK